MTAAAEYAPPKVWEWDPDSNKDQAFGDINRPAAGARFEKELPVGEHPLQLYSLATPNGVKATILLEELLAKGHAGAEYDAWMIKIQEGEQFGSGFVAANPNAKIPALVDRSIKPPQRVFESGAILLYLADKFGDFIPADISGRAECLSWLFWQMGTAPLLGGGFGHFYAYAPVKIRYAIDRYTVEAKRQLDLLDRHLATNRFMCGDDYSIADMAIFPWFSMILKNKAYKAAEFLAAESYRNLWRWMEDIDARPAVRRGKMVNRPFGAKETQLWERHDASDFELRTQAVLDPDPLPEAAESKGSKGGD